jgi:hypothetical protein
MKYFAILFLVFLMPVSLFAQCFTSESSANSARDIEIGYCNSVGGSPIAFP